MPDYRDEKYRDERIFQLISRRYLTLHDDEMRANNVHLQRSIENCFIPFMRKDPLFNVLFQRVIYGGSYYKGTKVGKPDEFDLDFVIKLPINYSQIMIDTNHNNYGFVKIKIDTRGQMHPDWEKYKHVLSRWLTSDNYLDQNKFRAWMEEVVEKAFDRLPKTGSATYGAELEKNSVAFTTKITHKSTQTVIDVDLIPCLEFDNMHLSGYRYSSGSKKKWMVFAKPLSPTTQNHNILWGHDFCQEEKELLCGEVKPAIRMMKKFRDTMKWTGISSYCIETIFLHELYELQNHTQELDTFLRAPKTGLFMHGLRKLKEALERKNIPYYWHPSFNLIGKLGKNKIEGYANRLNSIINKIDSQIKANGYILADVVLEPHESRIIKEDDNQTHEDKIVGGDYVRIEDVPYQANLLRFRIDIFCGATIIHESWVVTATHCVENGTRIAVRTGAEHRSTLGKLHRVEKIIMHEDYDISSKNNDIALIKLAQPIIFNQRQQPVELAKPHDIPREGELMRISGFGKIGEHLSVSNILKAADVPIMNQANCERAYRLHPITDNMFCAGNGDADACHGDSGGPGVIHSKLYGIISSGTICGSRIFPGVYTAVYKYHNWIEERTGLRF